MSTCRRIVKGFGKITFPEALPDQTVSVITSLGKKSPEERLTMGARGIQTLKEHEWFAALDWQLLEQGQLSPPFNPKCDEDAIESKVARREIPDVPDMPP